MTVPESRSTNEWRTQFGGRMQAFTPKRCDSRSNALSDQPRGAFRRSGRRRRAVQLPAG